MKRTLLLAALVFLPGFARAALAQVPAPPRGDPVPPAMDTGGVVHWPSLVLPTNQGLTSRLEAARDYLRVQDYPQGLRQVQWILDAPEDILIQPKPAPGKPAASNWQSVRLQAESLLEELTPQGRDTYRTLYEPQARTLLDKARQTTDPRMLAVIVRRFRYTSSGATALALLANYDLDRGRYQQAAHRYASLLRQQPVGTRPVGFLVRAVTAFRGAGDTVAAAAVWQALQSRASGGKIKLGGRDFSLAQLEKGRVKEATVRADARVYRGDECRNGVFAAKPPLLEPFVRVPAWTEATARDLLTRARSASPTALPGRHMIATGNKVLFRGAQGIVALDSATGRTLWTAPLELGLEGLLRDPGRKQQFLRWVSYFAATDAPLKKNPLQGLLYENTLTGTLSTDGQNVYAVEDTALPVPPFMLFEMAGGRKHLFSTLGPWLACNRLRAFDLATGKPAWQIGGSKRTTVPEFADVLFLGPPLPLEGLLWVLVEKQQKMVLYALDPATGARRWSQNLGTVSDRIQMNLLRRCSAVHLAAADGLLIVPTHHGAVFAVDPLGRNLVWAHSYADKPALNWENITPDLPEVAAQWQASYKGGAPLIADGRIVLTGPDTQILRCLNLADGSEVWRDNPTEEGLYVAGIHKGTVLVIGRHNCRGLSLKDGQQLWRHATAAPSGQGVFCAGTYWLPLQEGGLLAIDVATGKPPVRLGSAASPVLGNLLVHEGTFWSQDVFAVSAFPGASKRLLILDERLLLNPENRAARLDRAQMRLGEGATQGAIQDVRLALASTDLGPTRAARARELLFNALTQLLQRDPVAAAPFLPEYLDLCDLPVPAASAPEARAKLQRERVRRRSQAAALVARGYAAAGHHRAAAELLLRRVRDSGDELIPTPDDPEVAARADVLAERQLREILRAAPSPGQVEIRAALGRAAHAPMGPADTEGLLRVGRLADLMPRPDRLLLLERLLALNTWPARVLLLLDGLEGRLSQPADVAGVLLVRAEALTRAGLSADAADCYRRLGRDFATLAVRPGATGAQLLEAARQDKRLLASFEAAPDWSAANYQVREERGTAPEPAMPLVRMTQDRRLDPRGSGNSDDQPLYLTRPAGAMSRSLRVAYDWKDRKLHVQDLAGVTLWSVPTLAAPMDRLILPRDPQEPPPVVGGYVVLGSMAVVHVNTVVYGLDLLERRLRWSLRLMEQNRSTPAMAQFVFAPEGRLEGYNSNTGLLELRIGLASPAGPDRILIQLRGALAALDPATGAFLWRRGDDRPTLIVGDAEAAVLLESSPNDNTLRQVRAIRPDDGRLVRLGPGVRELLLNQRRVRWLGHDVLLQDNAGPGTGHILRRVDVLTGKDRWTLALPPGAALLDSPLPATLGVLRPVAGGTEVRPLDLTTGKESAIPLAVGKDNLAPNEQHVLLADAQRWYIVARTPVGAQGFVNEPNPHVPADVPTLVASGTLLAYDRSTGRLQWRARLPGQVLIADPFEEIPFVLAVSQTARAGGNDPNGQRLAVLVRVLDKKTGKLLFNSDEEMPSTLPNRNPPRVPYFMPFHGLTLDPLGNWLELAGPAVRLRVTGR